MTILDYLIVVSAALAASWARMAAALFFSIMFSLVVGIAAGTNKLVERITIPILDILQSIPILGFFPLALVLFYNSFPIISAELASIFLIFTSQVWNITFAVYESTRLIKTELIDTAKFLGMGWFDKLRYLYIPASMPRVLYNIQPSWANGLFFLVGSEILTFGEREVELFGLGTVISRFTVEGDMVGVAITLSMLVFATVLTILFVFIPLTNLSEPRRKHPKEISGYRLALRKVIGVAAKATYIHSALTFFEYNKVVGRLVRRVTFSTSLIRGILFFSLGGFAMSILIAGDEEVIAKLASVVEEFYAIGPDNLAFASLYSLGRVAAAVSFSVAWSLPAALLIARRPMLSTTVTTLVQILASVPVTLVYPLLASLLSGQHELRAFLMTVAATQYYVFFQVLSGFKNIPVHELEVADLLGLKTMDKVRTIYIPRTLPALVTGCITAAGGAWNSLVVSERLVLGSYVAETNLPGLGKLLSLMTYQGNFAGSIVVIIVMSSLIVLMNRLLWKKLYDIVISKLKIEEYG